MVDGWGIGREGDAAVAVWNVDCRGHEGLLHSACGREFVDVGAVFIANPETAVGGEEEAFAVNCNAFSAAAGIAKTVTCVRCYG